MVRAERCVLDKKVTRSCYGLFALYVFHSSLYRLCVQYKMAVDYLPCQLDVASSTSPIPYTASPLLLLWSDIQLTFRCFFLIPGIVFPIKPWHSGALDELYPSLANIRDIVMHTFLIFVQLVFILSLPLLFIIPFCVFLAYVAAVLLLNWLICKPLNGSAVFLNSKVDLTGYAGHDDEKWIFVNGVAAGHHWLQSNLDRLAMTFGRPVLGIHNTTTGIIFDILECLIQRDFRYDTQDIRSCYAKLKDVLSDDKYKKVVLILHSQGGIEGGMVIDWLFADLPESATSKLEVYTFGNAANHFNSPFCKPPQSTSLLLDSLESRLARGHKPDRVINHIEHYTNSGDFVSNWGTLHFTSAQAQAGNRFVGRVFERTGSGHMFNQHYLGNMFPLDPVTKRVSETNAFMETLVDVHDDIALDREIASAKSMHASEQNGPTNGVDSELPGAGLMDSLTRSTYLAKVLSYVKGSQKKPVKELSRLWQYRNGRSPKD